MNNQQFRRLVLDKTDEKNGAPSSTANSKADSPPSDLGHRKSTFMPMAPRTMKDGKGVDFARQMKQRNASLQPTKKFKSVAPKGVKYGAGYTDRAKARADGEDATDTDDKASRVKALEEQMKLGQISQQTFEALRDEIAGGDLESTHLVKGLDRKLLERVRRGEDVLGTQASTTNGESPPDVEEELDRLVEKEVEAVKKVVAEKKGTMAAPAALAGTKRSRDEIMAELKAQRKAAADAKSSKFLDGRWKKVGEEAKPKIEIDRKGREVFITVDEDGVVKKKVRRVALDSAGSKQPPLSNAGSLPVLGSDAVAPALAKPAEVEVESDDDIFKGVGAEYNPLAGDDDDDDDDNEPSDGDADEGEIERPTTETTRRHEPARERSPEQALEREESRPAPRNYFKNSTLGQGHVEESQADRLAGVQQLLKKAAKMDSTSLGEDDDKERPQEDSAARLKRRAEMLAQHDRDLEDMDMGFGSSRYDDGEDDAEGKVKLSEWKGANEHSEDGEKGGGNKKKRKLKKRKGDANNMADIMRVIDGRKAGSKK